MEEHEGKRMQEKAKYYTWAVIALGSLILATHLQPWPTAVNPAWVGCLAVTVVAGALKLQLPRVQGTYSPTFLPILFGALHFGLPETLTVGCLAAVAQSCLNVRQRPTTLQVAFNAANLVLSIAAVYACLSGLAALGVQSGEPVALAAAAAVYFVVNTGAESGILARLQNKRLNDVTKDWYFWSLPYFLTGVAALALTTPDGLSLHWEAALVVAVLLGLLHFYSALEAHGPLGAKKEQRINLRARIYFWAILTAAWGIAGGALWNPGDLLSPKFLVLLLLTVVASTWKVRLPGLEGTISVNFVMLLAAAVELALPQAILVAAAGALVQCLWRPAKPPKMMPVVFSTAVLVISASVVNLAVHRGMPAMPLLAALLCGTMLLYAANTILVSLMFCLVEERSLGTVWHHCHFWTFNYYLVGAAAAGILVSAVHSSGVYSAALIMPAMALVWISFRLHTDRAAARHA